MTEPEYAIEATNTSIAVLETLLEEGSLGVTALARELNIAKSAAHNHLTTLRANGYVVKRDGAYEPSLRLLELGHESRARLNVTEARDEIENLARATGETTFLVVEEDHSVVPVLMATTDDSWEPPFFEGTRLPLHTNAAGKALLTTLSDERVDEILSDQPLTAQTDRTLTDPEEVRDQLARIRDDGVAFSKGEHIEGIVSVAAPLPNVGDARPTAICVAGPADTLHGRHLEEDVTGQVLSTAKSIHVDLTSS